VLRGPHQSCWVLKRQRPQQNRINHTKNRCVRTNSERKGQDGNRGETGILAQRAHTVANVLHQRFDEAHAARIAMFLFELFHSAEFQTRPTLGLLRRQAGLDELRDLLLEVEAQFVVKFGLHVFPAEEGAQAQQQVVQHGTLLSCLQDLRDGGGELAPGALFSFQLPAPEPRQLIKLRTAIVFRCAPASLDPTLALQSMERGVQGALRKINSAVRHSRSPIASTREHTLPLVEVQGETSLRAKCEFSFLKNWCPREDSNLHDLAITSS